MSYKHSNAVREIPTEEFESHTSRYILIELAHLSDNAGVLRYSQEELSQAIGLSRITVAREIKKLESKGLISKEKHGQYKVNIAITGTERSSRQPVQGAPESKDSVFDMSLLISQRRFITWWEENAGVDGNGDDAIFISLWDDTPAEVQHYINLGYIRATGERLEIDGAPCEVYHRAR